ncbi:MAG TPA: cytochrome P450 [Allosphingosinicella sp.]
MTSLRSAIARLPLARGAWALTRRLAKARAPGPAGPSGADWFDLDSDRATSEPFPDFERLRRDGPVHFLPRHGFWIALGHEEVRSALDRPELFSSEPQCAVDSVLLGADPPAHEAVRRLFARYFTGQALAELFAGLRGEAESLVRPRMDVVADFAVPLTRRVAARLVGLEPSEVEAILSAPDKEAPAQDLSKTSLDLLRRARIHARICADAGGLLDDGAACSLVRLLCRAATETSERLIVRAASVLLEQDALRREAEASPSALAQLVEEAMRLWPPEPNVVRRTTRSAALGGVTLPAGATVFLSLLAANRDPAVFDDPGRPRLDRSRSQHLAFSGGPHQCLGAGLGRRTAVTALQVLLDRSFRKAGDRGPGERGVVQGIETPLRLMVTT